MMIIKRFTPLVKTPHLQTLFASFLLAISLTMFVSATHAEDIQLDKIAALVNDDIVMFSEVRKVASRAKQSSKGQVSDQALIKDALESLILQKIQLQRAKALGIVIDDVAVDRAMLSIATQNKLNLEQFRIALIKEGHNYKTFRETIRERLYLSALQKRHKGSKKPISEYEVDDLIKAESIQLSQGVQYHLIDILMPAPNGTPVKQFNNLLTRTQVLRKKLLAQSSQVSEALIKKMGARSSDLGWKNAQSLSPAYIRTLSLMGVGELSNVVRDPKGFHILKLVEQRGGKRKITQQARVRHILIPSTDPQAKLKATILRNKILAGGDFAKLAKENSADKGSAVDGGNLGMMDPSSFVPPFAKAVRTLPLNSLSQPIQTQFGWHIIEVMERKTSDQTREALKLQAQSVITKEKQSDDFKNWLQGLRDEAYVEYRIRI